MRVGGETTGSIGSGLCVLLSVAPSDDRTIARRLARRVATLRVFPDGDGRMNLDLEAAGGGVLVVSQFTLHAETSRGHRPSFIRAGPPELAEQLCAVFADELQAAGLHVETGRFGAHMEVELVNDGPVTLLLDSSREF